MSDIPAGWVQRGKLHFILMVFTYHFGIFMSLFIIMHLLPESRSRGGQIYYYNTTTGESVWEKPTAPASAESGQVRE